jgi:hypothetical protein
VAQKISPSKSGGKKKERAPDIKNGSDVLPRHDSSPDCTMNIFADVERQRFAERYRCFRGKAKIPINKIVFNEAEFPSTELPSSDPDNKNVARLRNIFSREGCFRLDPQHHIAGSIDENVLQDALEQGRLTPSDLHRAGEPPLLHINDGYVTGLSGRHRLQAAKGILGSFEWWIVDLYVGKRSTSQPFQEIWRLGRDAPPVTDSPQIFQKTSHKISAKNIQTPSITAAETYIGI